MNTKVALAVIAVILSSNAALASRQGGSNNATQTKGATVDAKSGKVVRSAKKVQATAKAASAGVSSSDAAAAAGAAAFAKPAAKPALTVVKPAAPAPRAEKPRVAKDTKSSDASAQSPAAKAVAAITKAGLDAKLGGKLPELSASLAKDKALLDVAEEIVKTNSTKPQLAELNQARMEGLLHISKLSSAVRDLSKDLIAPAEVAQQAYVALVQNAGREAAGWPETTQKNMVELITKTNSKIAGGMSVEAAIEAARIEMLQVSKVKIDLAQIKRLCGKV